MFIITEAALKKIKATTRGEPLEERSIQRHPQDTLATLEENERRDIEKKRIELSYERQVNIIKEQNAILQEHLTLLKETQEGPQLVEKTVNPLDSSSSVKEAKQVLESCLQTNSKQPLKCSQYVKKFVETAASLPVKL